MIIHDGKRLEVAVNIGGVSKSQLEKILGEHGKTIIEALGKKLAEGGNKTEYVGIDQNGGRIGSEETEIRANSMEKIADIMATVEEKKTDLSKKIGNVKTTRKDVSKTIDILKHLD